jgi:hypothetical protein
MFRKINLFGGRMDAPAYPAKSALRETIGVIASKEVFLEVVVARHRAPRCRPSRAAAPRVGGSV